MYALEGSCRSWSSLRPPNPTGLCRFTVYQNYVYTRPWRDPTEPVVGKELGVNERKEITVLVSVSGGRTNVEEYPVSNQRASLTRRKIGTDGIIFLVISEIYQRTQKFWFGRRFSYPVLGTTSRAGTR